MGANTGETLQERSKGKDVRTSNIVAAKVRSLGSEDRYLWYSCVAVSRLGEWTHCPPLALSNFWPVGRRGAVWRRAGGWDRRPPAETLSWLNITSNCLVVGIFARYLTSISLHLHFQIIARLTACYYRPWPTPSAPPWDPAGWTS